LVAKMPTRSPGANRHRRCNAPANEAARRASAG
jgi:hypothetical protein